MAEKLLELTIDSARKMSYVLDNWIEEAVFEHRDYGWRVREIDPSRICLLELEIEYPVHVEIETFTVDTDLFRRAVQKAYRKRARMITLERVGKNIVLRETGDIVGQVGGELPEIPEVKLDLPVKYTFDGDVHGFFKLLREIGDAVGFVDNMIYVPTELGDLVLNVEMIAGKLTVSWNAYEGWGIYTADNLVNSIPYGVDHVVFNIGRENYPVQIWYMIGGNINATILIAPRAEERRKPSITYMSGNDGLDAKKICQLYKRLDKYDEWVLSTHEYVAGIYVLSSVRDTIIRVADIMLSYSAPENKLYELNGRMLYNLSCLIAKYYVLEERPLTITLERVKMLGLEIGFPVDKTDCRQGMIEFVRNNPELRAPVTYTVKRKKTNERLAFLYKDKVYVCPSMEHAMVTGKVEPETDKIYAIPDLALPPNLTVEIDTALEEGVTHGRDGGIEWWIAFDPDTVRELIGGEAKKKPLEQLLEILKENWRLTSRIQRLGWTTVWEAIEQACEEGNKEALNEIYENLPYFPASFLKQLIRNMPALPDECKPNPVQVVLMYAKLASSDPRFVDDLVSYASDRRIWEKLDEHQRWEVLATIKDVLEEYASPEEIENLLKLYGIGMPEELKKAIQEVLEQKKEQLGLKKEEELEALRHQLFDRFKMLTDEADKIYEEVIAPINTRLYREDGLLSLDELSDMAEKLRNAIDKLKDIALKLEQVRDEAYTHGFQKLSEVADKVVKRIQDKYIGTAEKALDEIGRYAEEKSKGKKEELRKAEEKPSEVEEKCRRMREWLEKVEKLREEWLRLSHLFYDELTKIRGKEEVTEEDVRKAEQIVDEILKTGGELKRRAGLLVSEYDVEDYKDYANICLGDMAHTLYERIHDLRDVILKDLEYFLVAAPRVLKEIKRKTRGYYERICDIVDEWIKKAYKVGDRFADVWTKLMALRSIASLKIITPAHLEGLDRLYKEIMDDLDYIERNGEKLITMYKREKLHEYMYKCTNAHRAQKLFFELEDLMKKIDELRREAEKLYREIMEKAEKTKPPSEEYSRAFKLFVERVRELAEEHGVSAPSTEELERMFREEWETLKQYRGRELEEMIDMLARTLVAQRLGRRIAREHRPAKVVTATEIIRRAERRAVPLSPEEIVKQLTPEDWYYILAGGVHYWWMHTGKSRVPESWLPTLEGYIVNYLRQKGEELMDHPENYLDYLAGYILYNYAGSIASQGVLHGLYHWWGSAIHVARKLWREAEELYGIPYLENARFIVWKLTKEGKRKNVIDTNGLVVFLYATLYDLFRKLGVEPLEKHRRYYRLLMLWKERGYPEIIEIPIEQWNRW